MNIVSDPRVKVNEVSLKLVPEPGVNIFEALANARPEGFISITIYPDNTAEILLHQEAPLEGVEEQVLTGRID